MTFPTSSSLQKFELRSPSYDRFSGQVPRDDEKHGNRSPPLQRRQHVFYVFRMYFGQGLFCMVEISL